MAKKCTRIRRCGWVVLNDHPLGRGVVDRLIPDLEREGFQIDPLHLSAMGTNRRLNAENIRRLTLPKALRTARINRIGLLLLKLPANVTQRSRQLWIKIKRDHPMRLILYRAMAAQK